MVFNNFAFFLILSLLFLDSAPSHAENTDLVEEEQLSQAAPSHISLGVIEEIQAMENSKLVFGGANPHGRFQNGEHVIVDIAEYDDAAYPLLRLDFNCIKNIEWLAQTFPGHFSEVFFDVSTTKLVHWRIGERFLKCIFDLLAEDGQFFLPFPCSTQELPAAELTFLSEARRANFLALGLDTLEKDKLADDLSFACQAQQEQNSAGRVIARPLVVSGMNQWLEPRKEAAILQHLHSEAIDWIDRNLSPLFDYVHYRKDGEYPPLDVYAEGVNEARRRILQRVGPNDYFLCRAQNSSQETD